MDGGHSIDCVRPDNGQVGHVEPLLRDLLHDGHPTDASCVFREPRLHLLPNNRRMERGQRNSGEDFETDLNA